MRIIPNNDLSMEQSALLIQIWNSVMMHYATHQHELIQFCQQHGLYQKYTMPVDAHVDALCIITQAQMERHMH